MGREGKGRKWEGGEERGRDGTSQYFIAPPPQFQFSRNMPESHADLVVPLFGTPTRLIHHFFNDVSFVAHQCPSVDS